jgi:uncharacterized protein (DUF58 family)
LAKPDDLERVEPGAAPIEATARALGQRVPPLLVAAERVAMSLRPGLHGRRRFGTGDAFWQFRRYQPDDPASRIDWRQTARAGAPFVRETEWEAAQTVWLWRDGSAAMGWRSRRDLPTKRERASLLLLALSVALDRAGELTAILGGDVRPSSGAAALARQAAILEREGGSGDAVPPPDPAPKARSSLVAIGDLLAPADAIVRAIDGFASRGIRGHLLQVVDPAEEDLPYAGRVRFEAPGGDAALVVPRVEPLRDAYRARLAAHRVAIMAAATLAGWSFAIHRTDAPAEAGLARLWTDLSQAGPSQRGPSGRGGAR